MSFAWTDDRIERLRKLWLDGATAAKVASELGNGVTRNAVIGKVHRLVIKRLVKRRWSDADRAKVIAMVVDRKMLAPEVAAAFDVSEEAAREQIKALKKAGRIPADALLGNYRARGSELASRREQAKRSAAPAKPKLPKMAAPEPKPTAKVMARLVASPVSSPKPAVAPPLAASISMPASPAASLPKVVRDVFTAPDDAYLVTIHELREIGLDCRWPFTCEDGQTRYCGKLATDGSWCCEHARLAYAGDARPTMKAYAPARSGRGLAMQREARA